MDPPTALHTTASTSPAFHPQPIHSHQPRRESDPFATHRTSDDDPFSSPTSTTSSNEDLPHHARRESEPEPVPLSKRDRRLSKEWDASKVPPSKFQKLEGSIFATPASRDGHVARNKLKLVVEKVKDKAGGNSKK